MNIIQIVPGSGGTFYCQNCLRDGALVQALRRAGEEVVVVPMYLPMFTDGDPMPDATPVFFGGINVWLQQQSAFFRKTPRWMDRWLDSSWVLSRVAKRAGATKASGLGALTLSMLAGTEGHQKKEVDRLVAWLKQHTQPDVIQISNALLLGLAGALKEAFDVPVICALQDEDVWLDELDEPYREQCWAALRAKAGDVDRFVAVSRWFADRMSERLQLPRDQLAVVPMGIDVRDCEPATQPIHPPVLGFLSRMNDSLGLGRLVDAFLVLKSVPGLESLQLRATGGAVGDDFATIRKLKKKIARAGWGDDVEFIEDFSRDERVRFLQSLSVMCVPVEQGEAFGSYILEAMAVGVPVVQPNAGAFPELIAETGGGVIYEDLAQTLTALLLDPVGSQQLGAQGRTAVFERYRIEHMAEKMVRVYRNEIQHD